MPHDVGWSYEVSLDSRDLGAHFYRAVAAIDLEGLSENDFKSNAALGKTRRWPDGLDGEDATDHFGLSSFDSPDQALDNALAWDFRRKRGKSPRWNGIAEFTIDPHAGHTYADTFEDGHWSVWARLMLSVQGSWTSTRYLRKALQSGRRFGDER